MANINVYTGDYIKAENAFGAFVFKRVESVQLCCDEFIVVFYDGSVMSLSEITIDMLYLESEVNL